MYAVSLQISDSIHREVSFNVCDSWFEQQQTVFGKYESLLKQ